jgi:bacillopeptidase F
MKKISIILVAGLLIMSSPSQIRAGEYSPAWHQFQSGRQQDNETISAIITMADQVDLRVIQDQLYAQQADRVTWHEAVMRALQENASMTQADLIARLEEMKATGQVEKYRSLWIGNIVLVRASLAALDELVSRADIMRISPDYQIESIEPVSGGEGGPLISGHELGLERIRANECWAIGITGEGRLVSHLDTGVDGDHPALDGRWAGLDPRYAGHPEWAWFDPVTFTNFPFDSAQRGTHVMGTICGLGGTDTIGVSFGANWISAGVIDRGGIDQTVQDALLALEWTADPDGDPTTVWDVPDVSCNAWGLSTFHGFPPCDETFWVAIDGCEAAGVVVVFGAGGDGPAPSSIRRPADRAITDVTNFAVGAVDGTYPEMPIASFSSRGPSDCTLDSTDTFKPEVVAPGVNIRSSVPGGGYQAGWSGTSMALAHVAGVVALVRQANPNLSSEQVKQILLDTASDRGSPGDDNAYGMGVVDAYEAVQIALQQGQQCRYVIGDINDDSIFNGSDVIYMVSYLKGGNAPPYSCECPQGNLWHVSGDVNASCVFNGIDITYAVAYFKGGAAPEPCPDCPPMTGR